MHHNDPANPQIVMTSPENIPAAAPPVEDTADADIQLDQAPQTKEAQAAAEHGMQQQTLLTGLAAANPDITQQQTKDNNQQPISQTMLNPLAPCQAQQFSCYRNGGDSRQDATCPAYKPIWAYYSTNKGNSWKQAGCYATEIDAGRALKAATKPAAKPNKPIENPATAASNSVPASPAYPATVPFTSAPEPHNPVEHASETEGYPAKFKGAFGLTVEKRTYRTAEMKQKALDLWAKERKLLEPDGSINERYSIQPQSTGLIPGH